MKTPTPKMKNHGWKARSVLECGDMSPLSPPRLVVGGAAARRARATHGPSGDKSPVSQSADKSAHSKAGVCLVMLLLFASFQVLGQSYSIDWFTVDGGGGTSTGSVYSVSGTIGQPDAGHMTGANYAIDGGFWGLISAVQTPGSPRITIARTATNTLAVSWPSPSTGFSLQQNTNLSTANWVTPAETINNNGTINFIIVSPPTGKRFYRLQSP